MSWPPKRAALLPDAHIIPKLFVVPTKVVDEVRWFLMSLWGQLPEVVREIQMLDEPQLLTILDVRYCSQNALDALRRKLEDEGLWYAYNLKPPSM